MKYNKDQLEINYALALTKMPFFVEFKDVRFYCSLCGHTGVTIKYFYLISKDTVTNRNFCGEACLNMYLIRRL